MGARGAEVQISDITIPPARLRSVRWWWVEALAEMIGQSDRIDPIEVVETGSGYRLVAGLHRLEAARRLGRATIPAEAWPEEEFEGEALIRLREVFENLGRLELTALDRCVHIAEWKAIYEALHAKNRGGRPSKKTVANIGHGFEPQDLAVRFSAEAQDKLGLSERAIRRACFIADHLPLPVRVRIALTPLAEHQRELELLAQEPPHRQAQIVDLMLSEPPQAKSVEEAIATIDGRPLTPAEERWRRLAGTFARLPRKERFAFFDIHREYIEEWLAEREAGRRLT